MKIMRLATLAIMLSPALYLLVPGRPWVSYVTMGVIAYVSYLAEQSDELKLQLMHDTQRISMGERYRFMTSALVHGGYAHLLFNLFALFSFAPFVEREFGSRLGTTGPLAFAAAVVALMIVQGAVVYRRELKTGRGLSVGASGLTLALFATAAVLYPMLGIVVLFVLPMKAWLFLVLFYAFTVWSYRSPNPRIDAAVSFGVSNNIHHLGHLVGMTLGLVLGGVLLVL